MTAPAEDPLNPVEPVPEVPVVEPQPEPDEPAAPDVSSGVPGVDEAPVAVPEPVAEGFLVYGNWRYRGDGTRTWTNVPVTVSPGDVIRHWGNPGPEHFWEPTTDEVTQLPDNHRHDELEATRLAEAAAAEEVTANG